MVLYELAAPGGGSVLDPVWLPILVFVVLILAGLIGSLRINAMGVFVEGVAPPFKPVDKLARAPFIIAWQSLRGISVRSPRAALRNGRLPDDYLVSLRLTTGEEILFSGKLVANRLGGKSEARRFHEVLLSAATKNLPSNAVRME